jgi:polysaccharide export outer membrane protein
MIRLVMAALFLAAAPTCQFAAQDAKEPVPQQPSAPAAKTPRTDGAPGEREQQPAAEPANPAAADPAHSGPPHTGDTGAGAAGSVTGLDSHKFIIGPEDVLAVRVWREPELSGSFMVRPDGKISLPLVNEIQAAGLTPEQLSGNIVRSLSKYMNRPEVSISVTAVNSRKYFIQGEVQRPGSYPLVVPTTVLEALVNAGGFREFANTKKIIILRKGGKNFRFNYKDVVKGKHAEQNILLEPGDQIIVN